MKTIHFNSLVLFDWSIGAGTRRTIKAAIVVINEISIGEINSIVPSTADLKAPPSFKMLVDVFADHNAVINQDSKYKDHTKHGELVDGHAVDTGKNIHVKDR